MKLSPEARRAVVLLYLAAAIVLLEELVEIFALTYPFHSGVASWRFGLLGVTVSRMAAFALADAMILGAAVALGHFSFLRIAGVVHLLLAVAVLPALVSYGLDWVVLRRALKPEFVRSFDLTAARTILLSGLGFLTGLLVFWATLRMKVPRVERPVKAREVLVGSQPAKEFE